MPNEKGVGGKGTGHVWGKKAREDCCRWKVRGRQREKGSTRKNALRRGFPESAHGPTGGGTRPSARVGRHVRRIEREMKSPRLAKDAETRNYTKKGARKAPSASLRVLREIRAEDCENSSQPRASREQDRQHGNNRQNGKKGGKLSGRGGTLEPTMKDP